MGNHTLILGQSPSWGISTPGDALGGMCRSQCYQGRFRSFPIQEDDHFLAVLRYIERKRGREQ
jgi:hypothetical protein